jgi:hypothetical protein
MDPRACLPSWVIGAEIASGQQRLLAYVSARSQAARDTQNVPLRMRRASDVAGQTARYA